VTEIARGASSNITEFTIASHVGTHIDAPVHFIPGARSIDQIPLERFTGPGVVVTVNKAAGEPIDVEDVKADVQAGDIVLLHTGWSAKFGNDDEYQVHPYLTPELARLLVEKQIKMLGVDCVNVEMPIPIRPPDYGRPIHKTLLGAEVLIIENLTNLDHIAGKGCRIYAFPIPYQGSDGAQARVVAELP